MHNTVARWTFPIFALLFLAPVFSGCRATSGVRNYLAYNTPTEDFVTSWRDKVWGSRAYNQRRHCFGNLEYEADFRAGFLAGYRAIAQGGDGCTPSLPPRRYWSWKYQSAEGQAKVNAWFSGYPHGVQAAEEDGIGNYYEIQLGPGFQEPAYENPLYNLDGNAVGEPTPLMPDGSGLEEIPEAGQFDFNGPTGSGVSGPAVIEPVGYFSTPTAPEFEDSKPAQLERLPDTLASVREDRNTNAEPNLVASSEAEKLGSRHTEIPDGIASAHLSLAAIPAGAFDSLPDFGHR